MKRILHLAIALAGVGIAGVGPAHAGTVAFSGTQSNTNAPGATGGRCSVYTISIANTAPFFSTGASSLGPFSTTQSHCLDTAPPLAPGAAEVPYYDGLFTYLFDGGATLFGDYTGVLANAGSPGLVSNTQLFNVTGGTGKFAGASGSFTGIGSISFAAGRPPISNISFSGSMNAPGVPEPAAWGLMVLGFAGLGSALRRRRRAAA